MVLNELGPKTLEAEVLAEYLRASIESDSGEGLSPATRRDWLGDAIQTMIELERDDLALPFVLERSDIDPNDTHVLSQLSDLQARLGDYEGQREALERQFELSTDPDKKLVLGTTLIEVLETQLEDVEDAVRIGRILFEDIEPPRISIVETVERLLRGAENWTELADFYESVASRLDDDGSRCTQLRKAAEVYDAVIGEPKRAAQLLERALETNTDRLDILRDLERLYENEGNALKRLATLEQQTAELDDKNDIAEVRLKIGNLCFEELEEYERAVDALDQARAVESTQANAVETLTQLLRERKNTQRVARILASEDADGLFERVLSKRSIFCVMKPQSKMSESRIIDAMRMPLKSRSLRPHFRRLRRHIESLVEILKLNLNSSESRTSPRMRVCTSMNWWRRSSPVAIELWRFLSRLLPLPNSTSMIRSKPSACIGKCWNMMRTMSSQMRV